MADRVNLVVQDITLAGITPVLVAADVNNHTAQCGLDNFILVRNDSVSSVTVTIPTPAKVRGLEVADLEVSVPAGGEKIIGPLVPGLFSQADGSAYINLSAVDSVTLGAFRIS